MIKKVNLLEALKGKPEIFNFIEIGKLNNHVIKVLKENDCRVDLHFHDNTDELVYIIEGKMKMEIDSNLIKMEQGDLILIPKGTKHRTIDKTLVRYLLIEIDGTMTKEI